MVEGRDENGEKVYGVLNKETEKRNVETIRKTRKKKHRKAETEKDRQGEEQCAGWLKGYNKVNDSKAGQLG